MTYAVLFAKSRYLYKKKTILVAYSVFLLLHTKRI